MEHGIYWIWKDPRLGKAQDNYVTVSGTEFYDIMSDQAQGRYFVRVPGETAEETLYMEASREDHERCEREYRKARYAARCREGHVTCLLDAVLRAEALGEQTLADVLVSDVDLEAVVEDRQLAAYLVGIMSEWGEGDRYVAANRFLAGEPMPIRDIAENLGVSYKTAREWVQHVRGRLTVAMLMYDPEMTREYAGGRYV